VITVHADHEDFYSRNLLFKKIGCVRNYSKVNGKPTILLNLPLSLPENLRVKRRIFPLHMLKYPECKELEIAKRIEDMVSPMSAEEFYTFLIDKSDGWKNASSEQKAHIKKLYVDEQIDHFRISRMLAKGVSKFNMAQDKIGENLSAIPKS
jgi:hypothetical protein